MTALQPDAMVDSETLGTLPGSVILSVGGVCFQPRRPWNIVTGQPEAADRYMAKISIESCFEAGLVADAGALRFWMLQPGDARAEAFSGNTPLREALEGLSDWYLGSGAARVWAHGAPFDPVVLGAAYRACGLPEPWEFRSVRDTRTAFDLAGLEYRGKAHTVVEDCLAQAEKVCEAFGILGLH